MADFLFYVFAALTVLASLLVVLNRNVVTGVMCMIVAFLGTAALFALLEAYFIAVLQVIVYAGAVMVLFVFIVMLLNVEASAKIRQSWLSIAAAIIALAILTLGIGHLFITSGALPAVDYSPVPGVAIEAGPDGSVELGYGSAARGYAMGLFSKYMLPVQTTGFLLLVAMIGVIVLSRRSGDTTDRADARGGDGQ
jgi:NADH-quinone oxidoreductase subunit J